MGKWTKEPWLVGVAWNKHDVSINGDPRRKADGGLSVTHVADCKGNETSGDIPQANADRIVACVEAMTGIPDPARFVEAAKQLRSIVKCQRPMVNCEFATGSGSTVRLPPNLYCDHCKAINAFDQALAAKGDMNNG